MPKQPPPSMTSEQLQQGWTPKRVGRRIRLLAETTSTNAEALAAADEPDSDGLAILADHQTAGRGRQGRAWLSPRRAGVLCSVLLIADTTNSQDADAFAGHLTLAAAVAGCEAIRRATEITPAIKWPNDLRVAGRKLGGILIESRVLEDGHRAWAVGIGINCLQHAGHFPPELADAATSLEMVTSHPVDRVAVARELLRGLDEWVGNERRLNGESVREAWLAFAEPIGRRVRLRRHGQEYTGRTVSIDPNGGLIVQPDNGRPEWFDPMYTTIL